MAQESLNSFMFCFGIYIQPGKRVGLILKKEGPKLHLGKIYGLDPIEKFGFWGLKKMVYTKFDNMHVET